MRVRLKGLNWSKRRLADGSVRIHYYAWRGGPKLRGSPGDAEFVASYNEAIATRKRPAEGYLFTLIAEFKQSSEYQNLSDDSKRSYNRYLKMIEERFGAMPLSVLSDPRVRGDFKSWRDEMAETPRKADYAWTTLARVLSVAHDRGRIASNPCARGGRLYDSDRADLVWSEADLAKLYSIANERMTLAVMMALWTGQRQGDLLALTWSAYDGKYIRLTQGKRKRRVVIPVASTLKEVLETTQRVSPNVLTNIHKRPWTSDGFRTSFDKLKAKAGITGLTFHDLRGSAVVRLALSGATVPEIATFTGHSLKDVEAILDKHYLGRDVKLAENAVRKLERKEKRTQISNGRQTVLARKIKP